MNEVCGDDRFEVIKAAKRELLEKTNIESRDDEMKVLDSLLFRMWQMGWLPADKDRFCTVAQSEMFDKRGIWAIELSCGHSDVYCVSMPFHCSYCGAKVVG